jgi:hypothetical protein
MEIGIGQVVEIRMEADGLRRALISVPAQFIPQPGQYLQAHALDDEDAPLSFSLFLGGTSSGSNTFLAAPPIPKHWRPGAQLQVRGPLGNGFHLPDRAKKIGLVGLGRTIARLMPLARPDLEVALFTDAPLPDLPVQVEANPLEALPEAFPWADLLAVDVPANLVSELHQSLGLPANQPPPCPIQVLVTVDMPCGGMAECGVCALSTSSRGYALACLDGPVFELGSRSLKKR